MKLYKPEFWNSKNHFFSIILLPITLIFRIFIFLNKKFSSAIKFNSKIICVGNINLGGTGKTPLAIFIANTLKELSKKTSIVRKYYKNHVDEHLLIKEYYNELIIDRDRINAIYNAERQGFEYVILDDGFQDYRIKKNVNILCFNENQLIGNGMIFPSGPLRDEITSLKDAHVVLINGNKNIAFENKILKINREIKIFYSKYQPLNLEKFKNKNLLALAGIANPQNFFSLLKDNNLKVEKELVFPDHYEFKKSEIDNIIDIANKHSLEIIMTEKDYFKVKKFNIHSINYLKVNLVIQEKEKFINRILESCNENF